VANHPDYIVISRDRDLRGRRGEVWVRRGVVLFLGVIPVLALLNVFGQRGTTSSVAAAPATIEVHAPPAVRLGLLYSARITIRANETLPDAALVLNSNWLEGMTLNTVEPSPVSETSQNGSLRLELGRIEGGQQFKLFLSFQVNPTTVSHRDQDVQLVDGNRLIATVHRTMTVYP
jgi:hypothetical protein